MHPGVPSIALETGASWGQANYLTLITGSGFAWGAALWPAGLRAETGEFAHQPRLVVSSGG